MQKIGIWFSWIAVFLISVLGQTVESSAGSIYAMEEVQGLDALLAEEGFKGSFQTSTNMVDTSASTGWTYDSTNKLYKNTAGTTGAASNIPFTTESDYLQQEWTNSNAGTSLATATNGSATVTISSGTWPTNSAKARISFDSGSTWYDVSTRDSATQLTLASNFTGTTGAYNWILRMSEFPSGTVQLNAGSVTTTDAGTTGNTFTGSPAQARTYVNRDFAALNDVTITHIGVKTTTADASMKIKIFHEDSSTQFDVVYDEAVSHGGSGLEWFTLSTPYVVPGSGIYRIGVYNSSGSNITNTGVATGTAYKVGDVTGIDQSGFADVNQVGVGYKYGASANVSAEYVSVSSTYASRIDTSAWSDINSLARTETLNGQSAYYWLIENPASSYGAGTAAKIWNATGGVWRNIARNNGGTWEYNNDATATASETWLASTVNDMLFAVSKAVSAQANNRMTGVQMAAISDANLSAPASSVVIGATLYSSSSTQNPSVDNIAINYDTSSSALDLRTREFPVSAAPSKLYVYVVDKQELGTPSYYVTRDGGAGSPTWIPVTMGPAVNRANGRTARRGAVDMAGAPTGMDIRLKVTAPAGSSYEVSAVGLEGRQ